MRTEKGSKNHSQLRKKGIFSEQNYISTPFLPSEEFHKVGWKKFWPKQTFQNWNLLTEVSNRSFMQKHFMIAIAFLAHSYE